MPVSHLKSNPGRDLRTKYELCSKYIGKLESAIDLYGILDIHKEMWKEGLQSDVLGPGGRFRTRDISFMTADEVVLGDINGIWSNPIPVFERPEFKYSGKALSDDYRLIVSQYRDCLLHGVLDLRNQIYDAGFSRRRMEKNIEMIARDMYGDSVSIQNVVIEDKSLQPDRFVTVSFDRFVDEFPHPDVSRRTSTVYIGGDGNVFVPKLFEKGFLLTEKNFLDQTYADMGVSSRGNVRWVNLSREDIKKRPRMGRTGELSGRELRHMSRELDRNLARNGSKIGI